MKRSRRAVITASAAAITLILSALPASAAAGDLDPTFGRAGSSSGKSFIPRGVEVDPILTDVQIDDWASAADLAFQPDGKIVVGSYEGVVRRFTPDGQLDRTFGVNGETIPHFENSCRGAGVAVQSDGSILLAGSCGDDFALLRYTSNGLPDLNFGFLGVVTTDLGGTDQAYTIALQPDGKIVLAGLSTNAPGLFASVGLATARYLADGSLDPTFGTGGSVITALGNYAVLYDVAIQPDGKIVATGFAQNVGSRTDIVLTRLTSSGGLDPSFGGSGIVTTNFGGLDRGNALAVQPDGRIIVAGQVQPFVPSSCCPPSDFALLRFTSEGTLDPTFGSEGLARTDLGGSESFSDLALQPDGRIVAVGFAECCGGLSSFAVARYLDDGGIDTGFGNGGTVQTPDFPGITDFASSVAIQPDGKIVVGGTSSTAGGCCHYEGWYALARYLG